MAQDNEKRYRLYAARRSEVVPQLHGETTAQSVYRLREVYRRMWIEEEPAAMVAVARTYKLHSVMSESAPIADRPYHAAMAKKVALTFPELELSTWTS